ncbi:MAG: heme-copper oxidase subunit III [Chitinophagales bacterium]
MPKTIIHSRYIIHPYRFNLWLAIVAMVMMFAAFTSAYIVKKGNVSGAEWNMSALPQMFTFSTIVIVFSSALMHVAYLSFRRNNIYLYRLFITLTCLAGIAFLTMQMAGWMQWTNKGVTLTTGIAGAFIYIISGAHFLHVLGGVIALIVFSVKSFTRLKNPVDSIMENIDPNRQVGVSILATYWHFVDILWLYLFFFFQYA